MNSQLTSIAADQHRSDLLAAGARSRRTAAAGPGPSGERQSRVWRHLRRRPVVA